MVKTIIPLALIAISASFVLAEVPEVSRREASDNDLLARDDTTLEERNVPETMFRREEDVSLQEREPFAFLAPLLGRVAGRIASKVGSRVARHHVNNRRRRRDLDAEDEVDFAAREDVEDEMVEREMSEEDILDREVEEDILDREVDEDLYLD